MFLINSKLRGFAIPDTLPEFLQPEKPRSRTLSSSDIPRAQSYPPAPVLPKVQSKSSDLLSLNEEEEPAVPPPAVAPSKPTQNVQISLPSVSVPETSARNFEILKSELEYEKNRRIILEQRVTQLERFGFYCFV